jgi:hypothetical protein
MDRGSAIRQGLKTYDSGKICRRGHKSQRYTSTGACLACLAQAKIDRQQLKNAIAWGWSEVTLHCPPLHLALLDRVHAVLTHQGQEGNREALYAFMAALRVYPTNDPRVIIEHRGRPDAFSVVPAGGAEDDSGDDPLTGEPAWSRNKHREPE